MKYSMSCLQMIKLHELHSNKSFPIGIRVSKRGKNTNIYQIFVKEKYNFEALKETLFLEHAHNITTKIETLTVQ